MAITDDKAPVFLDTNILIYANVVTAPFHEKALTAIQSLSQSGRELWISRQILREYIAVITREQTFMKPMASTIVMERIHYFQSHFNIAEDNASVTENLLNLLETVSVGGKQIHDANIVATMQSYDIAHLLTVNISDFARFASLINISSLAEIAE